MSDHYDMIDRFLRNNLDDADYAEYSAALDSIYGQPAAQQPLTVDEIWEDEGIMAVNADLGLDMTRLQRLVRAVEAAHGIAGGSK